MNPDNGSLVDREQVMERLTIIAPYTTWIRTYGTENGLENIAPAAHNIGLKTAIGAWLGTDAATNERQINELINETKAGYVDLAIVGSETLQRNDLSEDQLIDYIRRVKQEAPGINVTTADMYGELPNHPRVMAECDVIMYNSYPYWEGVSIDNAIEMRDSCYRNMVNQGMNKPILISETGWPSAGNEIGSAVPSPENSIRYLYDFASWASKNNVQNFYFEAFDETWKTAKEGPQGAHWGIWDKAGNLKPGMETVLSGGEPEPASSIVDFIANTTTGSAPLSVLFTDLSENATSRSWDIDSNGQVGSTDASFVYVHTDAGTYTVNLTARNENGTASKTIAIEVQTENSGCSGDSCGGSSGGGSEGGGSGGVSPELQSNVEAKELSQAFVTSGNEARFEFPRNATCVMFVSFDAKKTFGKTTTIAELLKEKSSLIPGLPAGEIYRSFNVWVGNRGVATPKNIENPEIGFKVEKSWLQNKSIDPASIILNRYNDNKWEQFPVNRTGEDAKYLYLTSRVSGYSSFAITGKAKSVPEKREAPENGKGNSPVLCQQDKPVTLIILH